MKFKRNLVFLILTAFLLFSSSVYAYEYEGNKNYAFFNPQNITEDSAHILQSSPVSQEEAYQRMMAMQEQYPEGTPYDNSINYTSRGKLNGTIGLAGAGCHAFALLLSDAAFGDAPFYERTDINTVMVGDILRINNDSHTVIVLEVHPDSFTIAEGNFNSSVHWGRVLDKASLNPDFIWTRYTDGTPNVTPNPDPPPSADTYDVYSVLRIYNPVTGEHLYTPDLYEAVYQVLFGGWIDEGLGWYAPVSGAGVYRIFNPATGDHLYTTDVNEKDSLVSQHGWQADFNGQPLFYAGGNTPVYRMYNPKTGRHLLTIDGNEYSVLGQQGEWTPEGVAFTSLP